MNDFAAGCAVLIILGACLMITKKLESKLSKELSRKIIHITMGIAVLPFPWIFKHRFSVVALAAAALIILIAIRSVKALRNNVGSPLLGVERKSLGEIYFIVAVAAVYYLSDEKAIYLSSVLVLTFADSIAALVGVSYGRNKISNYGESQKTGEGTAIFFIFAFIATLIPIQLFTEVGRLEVLLVSFIIGILAALVEAVSRNGLDNLILPFLVHSFLKYNITRTAKQLLLNLAFLAVIAILAVVGRKIIKISKLSLSYVLLFCYIVIIQSSLIWLIPPVMLYLTNFILPGKLNNEDVSIIFRVIESNVIAGLTFITAGRLITEAYDLCLIAYALSFSCLMINNSYVRFKIFFHVSDNKSIAYACLKAVVFGALPSLLISRIMIEGFYFYHVLTYFLCMMIVVVMIKLFYGSLFTKYDYADINNYVPARLTALAAGTVCLFYVMINYGIQYILQGA